MNPPDTTPPPSPVRPATAPLTDTGSTVASPGKASFRGPLKYEIETSSPTLEAGRTFTVTVRITNPDDVPVEIITVGFPVPAQFKRVDPSVLPRSKWGLNRRPSWHTPPPGLEYRFAEPLSRIGMLGRSSNDLEAQDDGSAGGNAADALEWEARPKGVTIQPGNTMCSPVNFQTTKRILFTPATYNLEAQIEYKINGKVNHDAVKVPLNIKAPLIALIVGGLPGAVIGNLLRATVSTGTNASSALANAVSALAAGPGQAVAWQSVIMIAISLLSSIALSMIVIVAFARKKDSQPFLSVEDFYGGLFVGFLVGYGGESWIQTVLSGTQTQHNANP